MELDLARKEVTGVSEFGGEGEKNRVVKAWLVLSSLYLLEYWISSLMLTCRFRVAMPGGQKTTVPCQEEKEARRTPHPWLLPLP